MGAGTRRPRGEEVTQRILAATEELLRSRSLDEVRVVDVLRLARVSVGAFYARFATRADLFRAVQDRIFDEMNRHVADMGEIATLVRPSPGEYVRALLGRVASLYESNAGMGRHLIVAARSDATLRARLDDLNRRNLDEIKAALLAIVSDPTPEAERAITLVLLVQRAVFRDALFFPEAWGTELGLSRAQLLEELQTLMLRHLGLDGGRGGAGGS